MNKKGFTLIELLIVVAIIGILAAVATLLYPYIITRAKINACLHNHSELTNYMELQFFKCSKGDAYLSLRDWKSSGGVMQSFSCKNQASVLGPAVAIDWTNHSDNPWDQGQGATIKFQGNIFPKSADQDTYGDHYIWSTSTTARIVTRCGENHLSTNFIEKD
tara:strand:+ start:41 stop:526 length:486 start_codon:yes stop_codon:yes gene_type:complete